MKLDIRRKETDFSSNRHPRIPLDAGSDGWTAPAISSQTGPTASTSASEGAMPWGVLTAYFAALASSGFLFAMAFSRAIDLG
jgi:hypothetical protein